MPSFVSNNHIYPSPPKQNKSTNCAQPTLALRTDIKRNMAFKACPPECKGPFADLAASRATFNPVANYEARDEQRFQSVLQNLRDGIQRPPTPARGRSRYGHAPQQTWPQTWPPPKPRSRGVRVSEPLPSTTRAPGNSNSFSYPAFHSSCAPGHYQGGRSAQRPTFHGQPSDGPVAPASERGKERVSST